MTTPHSPTLLESDPQSSETPLENNDLGKELLEAARLGDTNRVSNLMSNGAPLTNDWLGTTPLHLASIYGHTAVVEILIKSGISRDGRNKVDKAPLHFACQHGHFEIVKLLVDNGANVNSMDMLKMTPLHWAVEANNYEICLLLLKFGVKTTLQNKFGKTALQIAKEKSLLSIVDLLNIKEINVSASSFKRLDDFGTTFHCGNATSTSSSSHTTNSIVKNSDLPTDQIAHSIYLPSSNIHIPLKMPSEIAALSKDSFNPNILHSGIPVITSLALSMLPPSIQAIPLSIGSSYSNQETTIPISLSDTSNVFCTKICCSPVSQVFTTSSPKTVSQPITSCNTQVNTSAQNPIPTVQPPNFLQEPTVPINIPFSLLTQIIDSGVKLYARQSISDVATGFVGIDTPMGTIPILPSSMEDGLQLIAVGNESNMASSLHFPCSQTSTTVDPIHQTGHNSVPLCFHSHGLAQYPVGAAGVNLISTHNGGLDFPSCMLENKGTNEGGFQLIAVGNERGTIPSNSLYYSQPSTSNIPLQQVVPNQPSPLFFHSHSINSHPMRHPGLFSVQNGGFHFSNGFFDQKSVVAQSSPMFLSNGLCVQPYIKQYCHPLLPPLQSLDLTSHNHIRPIYVPVNSNPLVHQSSLFPYYGQPILMPPIQSSADFLQQAPITSTEHSPTVYKSSVSKGTITENMLTPEPDSST